MEYYCFNGEAFPRFAFIQYDWRWHALSYLFVQVTVNVPLVCEASVGHKWKPEPVLVFMSVWMQPQSVHHFVTSQNILNGIVQASLPQKTLNVYLKTQWTISAVNEQVITWGLFWRFNGGFGNICWTWLLYTCLLVLSCLNNCCGACCKFTSSGKQHKVFNVPMYQMQLQMYMYFIL